MLRRGFISERWSFWLSCMIQDSWVFRRSLNIVGRCAWFYIVTRVNFAILPTVLFFKGAREMA